MDSHDWKPSRILSTFSTKWRYPHWQRASHVRYNPNLAEQHRGVSEYQLPLGKYDDNNVTLDQVDIMRCCWWLKCCIWKLWNLVWFVSLSRHHLIHDIKYFAIRAYSKTNRANLCQVQYTGIASGGLWIMCSFLSFAKGKRLESNNYHSFTQKTSPNGGQHVRTVLHIGQMSILPGQTWWIVKWWAFLTWNI